MSIREARPSDFAAVDEVEQEAFGDHGTLVVNLIHALRPVGSERGGLELVAEDDDGRVVGHVLFSAGLLDAPSRLVPVQVLSPIAVSPDRQGMGIGKQLITHGAQILGARRVPAIFLEGDPGFYSRVGFVQAGDRGFRKPSLRIPDEAFQLLPLPAFEPWMSGTLVYADPFWTLDAVGLR
ncbi:GNAT family N-acetyltransferase [Arthrobacter sp. ISL-30]|uniref:GNAT family N-acetyltransferase n=1 Tax=Arthrobacter sp. ISL-30 TaxID=2819109 RepID=UPI002034B2C7|nr:N-acetyltransferase [Arthrobacter sp. ISL-30]